MSHHRILAVLIIALTLTAATSPPCHAISVNKADIDTQLKRLDNELTHRSTYIDGRQHTIDSLRQEIDNTKSHDRHWLRSIMKLADSYNSFNIDSALYYYSSGYDRASNLSLDSIATVFKMRRSTVYPIVGFIRDAEEAYQSIDTAGMSRGIREEYYDAGRQMFSYISSFYINYPEVHDYYSRLALESQLALLGVLPQESPKYKLNLGEYFYHRQEFTKAKVVLEELLGEIDEKDNTYARAAHILSDISKARGNNDEYLYYLTLSAIADVKSATLEVNSLQELGRVLFEMGDVERAHRYLLVALESAVSCHAAMRMIQTAEAMPLIEEAHKAELDRERVNIYIAMGIMVLLVIALILTILYIRREMRHMADLQRRLEGANQIKDVYLSQFLSLCSIYMDKLNQLCKIVNRKISAGKVDDLYKMTKSAKFIEGQSAEFYEVFDDAFLHIYPTFVDSVNALMRDDEKIILAEGEKLNTDLRILAFMRLGIEDAGRIAQVLNYSVNTIYTYRNRLKNKAVNRDDFERDLMKISSIN